MSQYIGKNVEKRKLAEYANSLRVHPAKFGGVKESSRKTSVWTANRLGKIQTYPTTPGI
jgi:hypothetical protein